MLVGCSRCAQQAQNVLPSQVWCPADAANRETTDMFLVNVRLWLTLRTCWRYSVYLVTCMSRLEVHLAVACVPGPLLSSDTVR